MKNLILIILVTMSVRASKAQERVSFYPQESYKVDGVIFPANYQLHFQLKALDRYTPSLPDIKRAERFILGNDQMVRYSGLSGVYKPVGLKQLFTTWKRQYLGYRDKAGDSIFTCAVFEF